MKFELSLIKFADKCLLSIFVPLSPEDLVNVITLKIRFVVNVVKISFWGKSKFLLT